jgi:integrase
MVHVRRQVQRVRGQLLVGPTKTRMSQRDLPLLLQVQEVLVRHRDKLGGTRNGSEDLVFITATGRPIWPRNLVRTLESLCDMGELRRIRLHDLRRTVASLLNKIGAPPRDAQQILGHARVAITQEIYRCRP